MPTLYFNSTRYVRSPMHYGHAPDWLLMRMREWGGAVVDAIVSEHGQSVLLARLSDPFWFQVYGSVLGMDWHSSGITTTVMGTLKTAVNQRFNELGIYICGGRGKHSRQTPDELSSLADRTGLNGADLIRASRLSAKVDNTALQDGFQIYMHSFIVTDKGEWVVIQQGMSSAGMARRYHWHSANLKSFVEHPHTAVYGQNQGKILNLTATDAKDVRERILDLIKEPTRTLPEIQKVLSASNGCSQATEITSKWVSSFIELIREKEFADFESLLLTEGVGPKTIRLLALASKAIYGTALQFEDPAHFPFSHDANTVTGSRVTVGDNEEIICTMRHVVAKAKIDDAGKRIAFQNLDRISDNIQHGFELVQTSADKQTKSVETIGESRPSKNGQQLGLFSGICL